MPSYHLCPDFRIPPPPNGHLTLGSILKNLEEDGVQYPLNTGKVEPIPQDALYPKDGPHTEKGFTRDLVELRSVSAGIWSKIFGGANLTAKFTRSRSTGQSLTVKELLTRTFIPDEGYTQKSLETPSVKIYVTVRKLTVPIYMVTGIMVASGAHWSSTGSKVGQLGAGGGFREPHSGSSVDGRAVYSNQRESTTGVEDSDNFVLGIRVRKIWWEKGVRQTSDKVAGRILDGGRSKVSIGCPASGLRFAEDFELDESEGSSSGRIFVDKSSGTESDPIIWILPQQV